LLAPSDPSRKAVLHVRWVVADIYDVASNTYSRRPDEPRTAEVPVAWPYPASPDYLVLHFYPDGHVEAELKQIDQSGGFLRLRVTTGESLIGWSK
jgi:hypothetical protein